MSKNNVIRGRAINVKVAVIALYMICCTITADAV